MFLDCINTRYAQKNKPVSKGMTIKKKILPMYFRSVIDGTKTFELRKDEDGIQVGDTIELIEWTGEDYTGRSVSCEVTYVLRNVPEYGLMEGYCIIGIKRIINKELKEDI